MKPPKFPMGILSALDLAGKEPTKDRFSSEGQWDSTD